MADRAAALTIAMGATGILGGQAETVAGLAAATRPGGTSCSATACGPASRPSHGLAAFGMTRDELADGPDGFARWASRRAWRSSASRSSALDEWDAYESSYATTVEALGGREPGRSRPDRVPGTRAR